MTRPAVAVVCALALGACGQKADEQSSAQKKRAADALLLKDHELASAGLEQRLAGSIQFRDGLIVVHDSVIQYSYVLPKNSAWTISCGFGGFYVLLGNGVSGDGNEIELRLTDADIEEKDCVFLGLRLGKRLQAILQGDQSGRP